MPDRHDRGLEAAAKDAGKVKKLKIGWISPTGMTSPPGSDGAPQGEPMSNGFRLFWDQVGHVVAGLHVELVEVDETGDPATDLEAARRLVEIDRVDVIGGIYSTPVLYAVRDYLEQAPRKVVAVVPNAGGTELDTVKRSDFVVRVSHSNIQCNKPLGTYAATKLGLKRLCLSTTDFARGHESAKAFAEGFTSAGGEVVDEVYPPVGTEDFRPYLSRIKASGADCAFNFYAVFDAVPYVRQAAETRVSGTMTMLNVSTIDAPLLPQMGDAALGFVSGYVWYETIDNAENKKFLTDYKARFGNVGNRLAVLAYDAARLIYDALKKTGGDPEPEGLLSAMQGHSWNSPRGLVTVSANYNDMIQNMYVAVVRRIDDELTNVVVDTVPNVPPV